jgi:hypothetical protein
VLFPDFRFENSQSFRNFPDLETIPDFLGQRLLELTERIIGRSLEADDKELKVKNFMTTRLQTLIDFVMSFVDNLLDKMPEYAGLDPQECIQRSVCEAHKHQHRFGVIGRFVRFLFRSVFCWF